jgi:hypothetical protein
VQLAPGHYQVTAELAGYASAAREVTVAPQSPATVRLALAPLPARLRVVADMAVGRVWIDDALAGELQEGQLIVDGLAVGAHTIRIAGGGSETVFPVEIMPAAPPLVTGAVNARNLAAVVVGSLGPRARLHASGPPAKLTLNGAPQSDTAAEGVEITGVAPGPVEITLGDGPQRKTFRETFGAGPELTALLKSDQNIGTLLITTGEDDVRVFINNREHRRRTEKGQVRIQTIGEVTVRVQKPGFEAPPAQTVTVSKGQQTRLNFVLKELPRLATLAVEGGIPGTEVFLDQRLLGQLGPDGGFRDAGIPPGEHWIELRRTGHESRRFNRTGAAGQVITLSPPDSVLPVIRAAAPAPPPPPPPAAPPPKPAPPKRVEGGMEQFDSPAAWRLQEGVWRHRGAAALTYGLRPDGIFTFSIYMLRGGSLLRGGRVKWFLQFTDPKNYVLFELDEETLWSKVVVNGRTLERKKVAHGQDKRMRVWNIQIDVSPARLIHKIQGDEGWIELDNWSEPGRDFTQGKFGILVTGNDEVGLSNFQFTGR